MSDYLRLLDWTPGDSAGLGDQETGRTGRTSAPDPVDHLAGCAEVLLRFPTPQGASDTPTGTMLRALAGGRMLAEEAIAARTGLSPEAVAEVVAELVDRAEAEVLPPARRVAPLVRLAPAVDRVVQRWLDREARP